MPKQYAREIRRAVCVRLLAGEEEVSSLAKEVLGFGRGARPDQDHPERDEGA